MFGLPGLPITAASFKEALYVTIILLSFVNPVVAALVFKFVHVIVTFTLVESKSIPVNVSSN